VPIGDITPIARTVRKEKLDLTAGLLEDTTLFTRATLLRGRRLHCLTLVWPEGFFRQLGIEFAELGYLGGTVFVDNLGILALYVNRFIQRLDADQSLNCLGTVSIDRIE
jgi:hypothetical protein